MGPPLKSLNMGQVILFTIRSEYDSAQKLGFVTKLFPNIPAENFAGDVCIRWGLGGKVLNKNYQEVEFNKVINPGLNISSNCNKLQALITLSKAVNTPKLYQTKVPKGKLVVRRPINHTGGDGFSVQTGPITLLKDREYATQFIKTDKEFRVYYCANGGGKFMMCRRVTFSKRRQAEKFQCRSKWGYKFYKNVPKTLQNQVKKAFEAIGLEFGGADILFKNGKYYFCEINSACTVDMDCIQKFFVTNLKKLVKQKFPKFKITKPNPNKKTIAFESPKLITRLALINDAKGKPLPPLRFNWGGFIQPTRFAASQLPE